jgi:hypothetical protein
MSAGSTEGSGGIKEKDPSLLSEGLALFSRFKSSGAGVMPLGSKTTVSSAMFSV